MDAPDVKDAVGDGVADVPPITRLTVAAHAALDADNQGRATRREQRGEPEKGIEPSTY